MANSATAFLDLYHHSVRHAWRLEDLLKQKLQPNLNRFYMPDHVTHEVLSRYLNPKQQRLLSQLRGCEYLAIIILIEDVIIDFLLGYLMRERYQSLFESQQALANFVTEEMKHRLLFQEFLSQFHSTMGLQREPSLRESLFLRFVLKHSDLGIMLFILHGEIMTFYNYSHSVKDAPAGIDPFFAEILRLHWIEESSHIRLDELIIEEMIASADRETLSQGIQDYFLLLDFLSGALRTAIENDCTGLATLDQPLGKEKEAIFRRVENHFYIETYILDVLRSKKLRATLQKIDTTSTKILDERIKYFEEAIHLNP